MENLVTISPLVSEEKSFVIVDGLTDNGQMYDGACLYYKLPWSLVCRDNKMSFKINLFFNKYHNNSKVNSKHNINGK